ncbi:uncharacterized protein LOC141825400 [Curcuma longa]|uniref:uncharacterized protein LOC141825400 n=1 Tax=Curcuma longa TaxID=136217 RepID=UPI003D9E6B85
MEEVLSRQNNQTADDQFDAQRQSSSLNRGVKENIITLPKHTLPLMVANTVLITSTSKVEPRCCKESHADCAVQGDKGVAHTSRSQPTSLSETQKHSSSEQANAMSRPSNAPLTPALRLTAAISPIVEAVPLLSRSVSAAGRLGTDPSPSAASFLPQSYRNVIIGKTTSARMAGFIYDTASSVHSVRHFQAPSVHPSASSKLPPQTRLRKDQTSVQPGLTFSCLDPEALHHETCSNNQSSTLRFGSVLVDNMEKLSICGKSKKERAGIASATMPSQSQATIAEEFPHLDIINELLEDEQDVGWTSRGHHLAFD